MPRAMRPTGTDPALFVVESAEAPASRPASPGRHERAVIAAVRAADHLTDRRHRAAVTTLRALAAALDSAERKDNPYAVAQVAPRLHELIRDCGLLPVIDAGGGGDDDRDPFAALGGPALADD